MTSESQPAVPADAAPEPDPVIEACKKDVARTLLRENLKLTVEERLIKLSEFQRFLEELRGSAHRKS